MPHLKFFFAVLGIITGATWSNAAPFVIETADGLPIEVEMVSAYRDEISVKYTATQRVAKLDMAKLNPVTRTKINEIANEARKQIKSVAFQVKLEENSTNNPVTLTQRGSLKVDKKGAVEKNESDAAAPISVELASGKRALRIASSTNLGVDVPAVALIYWYSQGNGSATWSLGGSEEVSLNVTNSVAEYISRPSNFPRPDFRGWAMVVYNPLNDTMIWKGGSGNAFLGDAEARFAERQKKNAPPAPAN